jgi:DUF4097 and DUF4098 domain-containing protein YvlB
MRKTNPTLLFVLLAVCGSPSFADEWKKSFSVPGKADLRVELDDGEAIVRAWDRNQIDVRITTEGWKIEPSEVRVTDHQAGDRVEIEVRVPRTHISFGRRSVRVELQVPRELRASIHSGDGRISVQDLKGEIHLSTSDGSIEADAVDGDFEAKTGDGRIRATGRWDRLSLQTNDGSVDAEARAGSKMAGSWRINTGDGSVSLRLPENFAADLDAHTGDGKITVDFPVTASGSLGGSELRGKLNGGGQMLVVRTGDGPIRLHRL